MTEQRGLSFMDAIKDLAEEAGMEVPAPDPRSAERAKKQAGLHDAMAAAQGFFMAQLEGPEGPQRGPILARAVSVARSSSSSASAMRPRGGRR
jgi:DNA primase